MSERMVPTGVSTAAFEDRKQGIGFLAWLRLLPFVEVFFWAWLQTFVHGELLFCRLSSSLTGSDFALM